MHHLMATVHKMYRKLDMGISEATYEELGATINHIKEEVGELDRAWAGYIANAKGTEWDTELEDRLQAEVMDALCDMIWVAVGFAWKAGWDIDKAWDEVARSNATRSVGVNPKRPEREHDFVKGPDFIAPRVEFMTGKLR